MATDHNFVAPIWARRKVGYLLDQIRLHGESAEVKKELVKLAHDYSIATPYTSLLVVPESWQVRVLSLGETQRDDGAGSLRSMPLMGGGFGGGMGMRRMGLAGMAGMGGMGGGMGGMGGGMGGMGGGMGGMGGIGAGMGGAESVAPRRGNGRRCRRRPGGSHEMHRNPQGQPVDAGASVADLPSSGKEAIDLAERVADLKTGARAERSTTERTIAGRRFRKVGDAWVDQTFKSSMPTLRLRVLGQAYFQLLAAHPELSAIFALGNRVTWVTPSGTALIIDKQGAGQACGCGPQSAV